MPHEKLVLAIKCLVLLSSLIHVGPQCHNLYICHHIQFFYVTEIHPLCSCSIDLSLPVNAISVHQARSPANCLQNRICVTAITFIRLHCICSEQWWRWLQRASTKLCII